MTDTIKLPPPDERGGPPFFIVLARRRSVREFTSRELALSEMGQLLWAAQGVTDRAERLRAAPSAGALYPLELDVITPSGVFRFQPAGHVIVRRTAEDVRASLARAALGQESVAAAPCVIAISAVAARTTRKYGSRGVRYVHIEAGHAAQNILLMANALGLGGVPVGAFDDAAVARQLRLAQNEAPIYLVPVGWPRGGSLARFSAFD
jgi:SagB-type dehydrogenase family enzyme